MERGVALLAELVPGAFGEGDPTPERDVLFRIAVQEVTGREAGPAASDGTSR